MRLATILCLLLCACTNTAHLPPVIENSVPSPLPPTLADNLKSTVSVFYVMSDLDTGKVYNNQEIGVVVDRNHVLAPVVEEDVLAWIMKDRFHCQHVYFEGISITPYIGETSDHTDEGSAPAGAIPAIAVASTKDMEVLEVFTSLPMPAVKLAAKRPVSGDFVYTLHYVHYGGSPPFGSYRLRRQISTAADPLVFGKVDYKKLQDFAMKKFSEVQPTPGGVFNKRHEFVGFLTSNFTEIVGSRIISDFGYYVVSVRSVAPLLQMANVSVQYGEIY